MVTHYRTLSRLDVATKPGPSGDMFPIRDHNPSERTPYVTYILLAANILIFFYCLDVGRDPAALSDLYVAWGMIPARTMAGYQLETLITSMFIHGGWMHLLGNMLFLWIFGDNLEDKLGHGGFLVFYLVCGLLASGGQIAADPGSVIPNIGASGAIAGVLGGYLLMFPRAKVDILFIFVVFFRIFPIPAWITLGIWFGLQIFNGAMSTVASSGVAYWAHAGGFVAGFILMFPVWIRAGGPSYWFKTDGHPPHPEAEYKFSKSSIPRIPKSR